MDNEIIGKINAQYDLMIDDEHISAVLLHKETLLPQQVRQAIQKAAQSHAKGILTSSGSWGWICARTRLFSSAVAALCSAPMLEGSPMVAQARFVEDPKANALGYELLASHQLRL